MVLVLAIGAIFMVQDLSLTKTLPNSLFFYAALNLVAYQAFDALDGIHARAINLIRLAQFVVIGMFLLTGIYGQDFWTPSTLMFSLIPTVVV